jgi:hypothetical protein
MPASRFNEFLNSFLVAADGVALEPDLPDLGGATERVATSGSPPVWNKVGLWGEAA